MRFRVLIVNSPDCETLELDIITLIEAGSGVITKIDLTDLYFEIHEDKIALIAHFFDYCQFERFDEAAQVWICL